MTPDWLRAAVAEGLLPADAALLPPAEAPRPWPVLLLTALGAWIAALPLLGMVFALFGSWLDRGLGPYLIGATLLAGGVQLLRRPGLALFVEQLALPLALVGAGLLGFALFRDLPSRLAALLLLGLALGLAVALPRAWLRVLLGACAAGLAGMLAWPDGRWGGALTALLFWAVPHVLLLLWAAALWLQQGRLARQAALIEALAAGWLLLTLAGLCASAGMSFMVGGVLGGLPLAELGPAARAHWLPFTLRGGSLAFALAGAWLLWRHWPGCRRAIFLAPALALAALALLLPSLGGVLFALAWLAGSGRWRLAAAAGVALAWVLGSFYYQLDWTLGDKALLLLALGALLGLLAWRQHAGAAAGGGARDGRVVRLALLGGALLVLGAANGAIWQKEALIRDGRPVFVPLAPVDPRSLMQGDYMRLNFALPELGALELLQRPGAARPAVVLQRDARGVASVRRVHAAGQVLAADELLMQLTPKDGRWTLVSDAWFFEEGQAAAFEAARFGEFRVLPDGRALLVGMADQSLRPIRP
jgi:uncharacterized membrane-anchored protein